MILARLVPCCVALWLTGCGYHVSGHGDMLPKSVKTIAIPAFGNITTKYKLTDRLANTLTREFISRTRYRVVADEKEADAVLRGEVINVFAFPAASDQSTGRASAVQMSVFLDVSLIDRATGKVLYSRPRMEVRQRYEISVDQFAYFEESDVALERMSRDVARSVVSAVLEAF